jgi:transposase
MTFCQALLTGMLQHLKALEARIHWLEVALKHFVKNAALCRKIVAFEAVSPLTASVVVGAIGNAKQFSDGRHLAAWLGLVPGQYFSGCEARLQRISKRGDTYCQLF